MTDKYQTLRDGMPELQREAARKGGYNPRAQLIIDLLAERDALNAENERLREELDQLRQDAARWRALREMDGGEIYALLGDCDGIHPEQADAAIDRARGKEGE